MEIKLGLVVMRNNILSPSSTLSTPSLQPSLLPLPHPHIITSLTLAPFFLLAGQAPSSKCTLLSEVTRASKLTNLRAYVKTEPWLTCIKISSYKMFLSQSQSLARCVVSAIRPAVRPEERLAVRPEVRLAVRPVVRPVVRQVIRPVVRQVIRPVVRQVIRPVVRQVIRPVVRQVIRPVAHPVVRPKVRPVEYPVVFSVVRLAERLIVRPAAQYMEAFDLTIA
ncbi:hypothetical protein FHG87_008420 [Trinorchestia longiramus]|nr:hypothetical protein FHG87_008420 [Trinorchestia longiramus]